MIFSGEDILKLKQLREIILCKITWVKLVEDIWLNNHDFWGFFCDFLVNNFLYIIFSLGYGYTSS